MAMGFKFASLETESLEVADSQQYRYRENGEDYSVYVMLRPEDLKIVPVENGKITGLF